ncbi:MAG: hypothetical protein O7B25_14740 [Gammaproteobacteria bacterium]|nr:hypothetical protein [Gammaproteobacteria bacterium]
MYDDDETETVEEIFAALPVAFPSQLFNDEDGEDNSSYVRGYN